MPFHLLLRLSLIHISTATPYSYYRITSLGNENISWETVEKRNVGIDYSFFKGLIAGSVDITRDKVSIFDALAMAGDMTVYGDKLTPKTNCR